MDEAEFVAKKPFLFHLTPVAHVPVLRREKILHSAKQLIIGADGSYARCGPRATSRVLRFADATEVTLRDQRPLLVPGQMVLDPGFTLEDLVDLIDLHALFWTSDKEGLSKSRKYPLDGQAWIRVPTADLFACNRTAKYCRFNSGSPRAVDGKPSPRGPRLFLAAGAFRHPVGRVREVAFLDQAVLPSSARVLLPGAAGYIAL